MTTRNELARRRELEAANPGHRYCCKCLTLKPDSDTRLIGTSRKCLACIREYQSAWRRKHADYFKESYRRRYVPQRSDTPMAKLQRRNAELKVRGLFFCRHCETEKPLSERFGVQAQCKPCRRAWEREYARTRIKPKRARRASVDGTKRLNEALLRADRTAQDVASAIYAVFEALVLKPYRQCSDCLQVFPRSHFRIHKKSSQTPHHLCRQCQNRKQRQKPQERLRRKKQKRVRSIRAKYDPELRRKSRIKHGAQYYRKKGWSNEMALMWAKIAVAMWDLKEIQAGRPLYEGGKNGC